MLEAYAHHFYGMWNKTKIDKAMIPQLRPTSKASLKQQCLMMSNGDIDKASKLYDFMIKDMEELPMFDPIQPTTLQQVKEGAMGTMSWLNENKDDIMDWIGIIRGLFSKGGGDVPPSAPIPSIN